MTDYYSDIAPGYDQLHGAEQDAKLRELLRRAAAQGIVIAPNTKVLDVGCGMGRSAALLAAEGFSPDVIDWHGVEPSDGLVTQAPPEVRSRITIAPGEHIPFPDRSFSIVVSLTALHNYDDIVQGVQELRRVLMAGGVLLISTLRKSSKRAEIDALLRSTFSVVDSWEFAQDVQYICR
jgi:ubiquinone/menaquinone biosynthesis C-methylase UbiE